MKNVSGSKYEAPRAVRLSDATTASLVCTNGPSGTQDVCRSGFSVSGNYVCATGTGVQHF